jgi:hypothetical protein
VNHEKACPSRHTRYPPAAATEGATSAKTARADGFNRSAPFLCDYCGRGLKNAGSKVNHERACESNPHSAKYIGGVCSYTCLI